MTHSADCLECRQLMARGRSDHDPIHCIWCHKTWTGTQAQHCVVCHFTFNSESAADAHRRPTWNDHIDPSATEGWREMRPGVWTNGKPLSEERKRQLGRL